MTTTIGILGSGIMATGIVELLVSHDHTVIMRSRSQASGDDAMARIEANLARLVAKEKITEAQAKQRRDAITFTTELSDLGQCNLVIESIIEHAATKHDLLSELSDFLPDNAIIASNTSTLPIIDLAVASKRPQRFIGMHFFNPAPLMATVEVVPAITTDQDVIDTVVALASSLGKDPVVVKDQAGFIVNALLFPYLNEAIKLHDNGVASKEAIDSAMKGGCGFPMGPFALLDLVGLDTSLAIMDALYAEHKHPQYAASPRLRRMVSAGLLGRKTGQGFDTYG